MFFSKPVVYNPQICLTDRRNKQTLHSSSRMTLRELSSVHVPHVFWHMSCNLLETAQLFLKVGHARKLSLQKTLLCGFKTFVT
jgi:hypothetical protein